MKNYFKKFIQIYLFSAVLIMVFVLYLGYVYAALIAIPTGGYKLNKAGDPNDSGRLIAHGVCRDLVNLGTTDRFVPTKNIAGWNSFFANAPGTKISYCCGDSVDSSCNPAENCCNCPSDCPCPAGTACLSDGTCADNKIDVLNPFDSGSLDYKDAANTDALWDGSGKITLAAQGGPPAGEFLINNETRNDQKNQAVEYFPSKEFIVAWHGDGGFGNDSSGVFARRFAADGAALAGQFQVNLYETGNQLYPAIGVFSDNSFIIAWASASQDGNGYGVFAQRFDSSGNRVCYNGDANLNNCPYVGDVTNGREPEFRINSYTTNDQTYPRIIVLSDDSFFVVWQSAAQDFDLGGIFAKRFNSGGDEVCPNGDANLNNCQDDNDDTNGKEPEFRINSGSAGDQAYPAAALFKGAGCPDCFIVAWHDEKVDGVYARKFNSSGDPIDINDIQIDSDWSNMHPEVAAFSNNSYIVAWHDQSTCGSFSCIKARRFNFSNTAIDSETRINTNNEFNQFNPDIATFQGAGCPDCYIIAWHSNHLSSVDYDIYYRRFNADGSAINASDVLANTYLNDGQEFPKIAVNSDNDYIVTWVSRGQDGDGRGVYARIYDLSPTYQANGAAYSKILANPANSIVSAILTATESANGQIINHYLSGNNGANWEQVTSGVLHNFVNSKGNQLKWKSDLATANSSLSPEIFGVTIDINWAAQCLNSPVGYWKMDDDPNDADGVMDSSIYGSNGINSGATWQDAASCVSGSCLSFNNLLQNYVDMGDKDSLDMGDRSWTVMAWIKTSTNVVQEIAAKWTINDGWGIDINSQGRLRGLIKSGGDGITTDPGDGAIIIDGKWHHVAVTFDRDGDMVKYVDGKQDGSAKSIASMSGSNINNNIGARIGDDESVFGGFFNGLIDEVKIYDYALSPAEILTNCNQQYGDSCLDI